jgi:hypothetical protein
MAGKREFNSYVNHWRTASGSRRFPPGGHWSAINQTRGLNRPLDAPIYYIWNDPAFSILPTRALKMRAAVNSRVDLNISITL